MTARNANSHSRTRRRHQSLARAAQKPPGNQTGGNAGKYADARARPPTESRFEAADAGADFVFSGHTHAGQLWPGTWLVSLFNPHVHGIWREKETLGYVTSGLGLWHLPYRIDSESELVVIDIE